jgi:hypothetical protein
MISLVTSAVRIPYYEIDRKTSDVTGKFNGKCLHEANKNRAFDYFNLIFNLI